MKFTPKFGILANLIVENEIYLLHPQRHFREGGNLINPDTPKVGILANFIVENEIYLLVRVSTRGKSIDTRIKIKIL
jgi:hypothetical protein